MREATEKQIASGRVKGLSMEQAQHALSLQNQIMAAEQRGGPVWKCNECGSRTSYWDAGYREPYGCRNPNCDGIAELLRAVYE